MENNGFGPWTLAFDEKDKQLLKPFMDAHFNSVSRFIQIGKTRARNRIGEAESLAIKNYEHASRLYVSAKNDLLKKKIIKKFLELATKVEIHHGSMIEIYVLLIKFIEEQSKLSNVLPYIEEVHSSGMLYFTFFGIVFEKELVDGVGKVIQEFFDQTAIEGDSYVGSKVSRGLRSLFAKLSSEELVSLTDFSINKDEIEQMELLGLGAECLSEACIQEEFYDLRYLEKKTNIAEARLAVFLGKIKSAIDYAYQLWISYFNSNNCPDYLLWYVCGVLLKMFCRHTFDIKSKLVEGVFDIVEKQYSFVVGTDVLEYLPKSKVFWYCVLVQFVSKYEDEESETLDKATSNFLAVLMSSPRKLRKATCPNRIMKYKSSLQKYIVPFIEGGHLPLENYLNGNFISTLPKRNSLFLVATHLSLVCESKGSKKDYTLKEKKLLGSLFDSIKKDIGLRIVCWASAGMDLSENELVYYDDLIWKFLEQDERFNSPASESFMRLEDEEIENIEELVGEEITFEDSSRAPKKWFYIDRPRDLSCSQVNVYDFGNSLIDAVGQIMERSDVRGFVKPVSVVSALEYFEEMKSENRLNISLVKMSGVSWYKMKRGRIRIVLRELDDGAILFHIITVRLRKGLTPERDNWTRFLMPLHFGDQSLKIETERHDFKFKNPCTTVSTGASTHHMACFKGDRTSFLPL